MLLKQCTTCFGEEISISQAWASAHETENFGIQLLQWLKLSIPPLHPPEGCQLSGMPQHQGEVGTDTLWSPGSSQSLWCVAWGNNFSRGITDSQQTTPLPLRQQPPPGWRLSHACAPCSLQTVPPHRGGNGLSTSFPCLEQT